MAPNIAVALTNAIMAVCPIDGVSIGNANDKTTWRIVYSKPATDVQKKQALAVVASFDPTNIPSTPSMDDRLSAVESALKAAKIM